MAIIDFQPGADKAELLKQRDLLRAQLEQLNAAEPDEDSELYDDWADEHEDLEDALDELEDALDELEDN